MPRPPEDPELRELVSLQTHHQSHTCRKKAKRVCRFGFPKPPMEQTFILKPTSSPESSNAVHMANWTKIQEKLDIIHHVGETLTFAEFLESLSLSRDEYVYAVRASIKTATVFFTKENHQNEELMVTTLTF